MNPNASTPCARLKPATQLSPTRFRSALALCLFVTTAITFFGQDENEDVIELSPFEVNGSDDTGYRPVSTLAGSRTNMDLKDTANSIDVFTAELVEDLAITDVQDLTKYANNVETNESGWANGDGQEREVWNYNYMQIRGFKVGQATRNFMNLQTSYDSYNSERATFSKGPNAVLFGLGDPGGSMNYTTKVPTLNDDFNEVSLKLSSEGGYRATADVNRVLIKDKLAARLNLLHQEEEYYRKPGYNDGDAAHLVLRWKPLENTTITLGHEYNDLNRVYPRGVFPNDRFTNFGQNGMPRVVAADLPTSDPRNPNKEDKNDNVLLEGSSVAVDADSLELDTQSNTFVMIDNSVATRLGHYARVDQESLSGVDVDNPANLEAAGYPKNYFPGGPNGLSDTRFNITELNVTQRFGEELYIDFSFGTNEQYKMQGNSVSRDLWIDPNVGEHYGRFYVETSRPMRIERYWDINDYRLTGSYDLDFGENSHYFGTHRIALMGERTESTEVWDEGRLVVTGTPDGPIDPHSYSGGYRNSGLRPYFREYLDVDGAQYTASDWRDYYYGGPITMDGYTYEWLKTDTYANKRVRHELDSYLGVIQSAFLDGMINTTIGYRKESRDEFLAAGQNGDVYSKYAMGGSNTGYVPGTPAHENSFLYAKLPDEPTDNVSGISRNYGVVVHATEWLGFSYVHANNFSLPTESLDLYGNFLPSSKGVTDEYGVRFNLFEGRLSVNFNHYKTAAQDTILSLGGPTNLFQHAERILYENADVTGQNTLLLENVGHHTTQDPTATGEELLIMGNIGDNLTLRLSASRNVTVPTGIAPEIKAYYKERLPVWSTSAYANLSQAEGNQDTMSEVLDDLAVEMALLNARDNNENFPSSKYDVRFTGKYRFRSDSLLKGFSVGGSAFWRSAPVIGYFIDDENVVDTSMPYKGDDSFSTDLFFVYQREFHEKYEWRIQLNISNVLDDTDPQLVRAESAGTDPNDFEWIGTTYRPIDGRVFSLTSTIGF